MTMTFEQKIAAAGKLATESGKYVHIYDLGLCIIPDTLVMELVANGIQLPSTSGTVVDGRNILVYRVANPAKGPEAGLVAFGSPPEDAA